jgi:hypothetical protein
MKDQPLHNLLTHLAEEAIPPTEVNLWPGIRSRTSEINLSGDTRTTSIFRARRIAATVVLAALVFVAMLFLTPQGRSLAQTALRFFTPAQVTSFPIVPPEVYPPEPGPTLTQEATTTTIPPAENTTQIEPTPFKIGTYSTANAAEASIGIDIIEFPGPLPGLELDQVIVGSDWIMSQYQAIGGGGYLFLEQRLADFPDSVWQSVPQDGVEIVSINNQEGEYIKGVFTTQDWETATWNQAAPLFRLRWQDGDWMFELRKEGDVVPIEYLDRDNLIALASSLTDPTIRLDLQSGVLIFPNVTDAEITTGLQIFKPAHLPEQARLTQVMVSMPQQWITLTYNFGHNTRLRISQIPLSDQVVHDLRGDIPEGNVESVQFAGHSGWYGVDGSNFKALWWPGDQIAFAIYFHSNPNSIVQLERTDIIAIAESLK